MPPLCSYAGGSDPAQKLKTKAFVLVVKTFGAFFFYDLFYFLLHFLRGAQRGFGSRWHTTFLGSRLISESSIPTSSRRQPSCS